MDRLDDCLSFLMAKAAQQVTRRFRDALAPFGVTPVQYAVLHLLWHEDGLSGAEIGERLGLDSASVTGVADRMESAGLVERRADPAGDRRVTRLHVTARGSALHNSSLDEAVDALNRRIAAELGPQAPRFWEMLRRLGRGDARPTPASPCCAGRASPSRRSASRSGSRG